MNNAQFAKITKELCKSKGISISKMLSDCGIRKRLIYDLEKRDWTPSLAIAEDIANYLECSVDYLLGRDYKSADTENDSEKKILDVFRQLTDEGQKAAISYLTYMSTDVQYQKYTDIPKQA